MFVVVQVLYPRGNATQLPRSQPEGFQVGVGERALVGQAL